MTPRLTLAGSASTALLALLLVFASGVLRAQLLPTRGVYASGPAFTALTHQAVPALVIAGPARSPRMIADVLGEPPSIDGTYNVAGRDDDGQYAGTVVVTKVGGSMYQLKKVIGNVTLRGVGFRDDDILSVGWADVYPAVVAYWRKPSGVWDGVFFEEGDSKLGTEIATPIQKAGADGSGQRAAGIAALRGARDNDSSLPGRGRSRAAQPSSRMQNGNASDQARRNPRVSLAPSYLRAPTPHTDAQAPRSPEIVDTLLFTVSDRQPDSSHLTGFMTARATRAKSELPASRALAIEWAFGSTRLTGVAVRGDTVAGDDDIVSATYNSTARGRQQGAQHVLVFAGGRELRGYWVHARKAYGTLTTSAETWTRQ